MGLWDMIWFCDYYGVIRLFIIKSYFRGLLMILKRKSLQASMLAKHLLLEAYCCLQMSVWFILIIEFLS